MPPSSSLRRFSFYTAAGARIGTRLCLPQLILGAVVESYDEQHILVKHLAL